MKTLRLAIARIDIGNGKIKYQSGDGVLQSMTVSLGEQDRASSCTISLYDPGLAIANLFLTEFQRAGGIMVPTAVLKQIQPQTPLADGTPQPTAKGDDLAKQLISECTKQGVTIDAQVAYVLATAQVETSMGLTLTESASGDAYEGRADLGNTQPGDGKKFKGRGVVQVTGRRNYTYWANRLNVDFLNSPEQMADLTYAVPIAVIGMRDGLFTGKKLSDYINNNVQDFTNARRIINGLDKADTVAGYAKTWLSRLPALKTSSTITSSSSGSSGTSATTATAASSTNASDILGTLKDPGPSGTQINTGDGIIVSIAIAFNDSSNSKTFDFFLTGVKGSNKTPNTTQIQGKQIRAVVSYTKSFGLYQNITVSELAARIAAKNGATVEVPAIPQTKRVLTGVAQGENDYQTLLKAAKAQGLFVRSKGRTITIKPLTASDTTISLPYTAILGGSDWGESAAGDRILKSSPSINLQPASPISDQSSQILAGLKDPGQKSGILALATPASSTTGVGKGFEGSLNLDPLSYPRVLDLEPGIIISLTGRDNAIYRAYRVDSVTLTLSAGGFSCVAGIYLPVAISSRANNGAIAQDAASTGSKKQGAVTKVSTPGTGEAYMRLVPLKTQSATGAYQYELRLQQKGSDTVIDSVPCYTGKLGTKPVSRDKDRAGSDRPIPQGNYELTSIRVAPTGGSLGSGVGSILIQIGGTSPRAGLGIYWDALNSQQTNGGIATSNSVQITTVQGWYNSGAKKLVVDYGGWS